MDTAHKGTARRLLIFLAPIMLLAGCAAAPPATYPKHLPDSATSDENKHGTAPPASAEQPDNAGPAVRRNAAPSRIERPVPARPPPQPQPTARPQLQPSPPPPPSQPQATVKPAAPFPVQVCDPGGCFGPDGNRYNGGVGNVYLNGSGKLCQRMGNWMQCN